MAMEDIKSFGFPRWGGYGKETDATTVRTCDYRGCNDKADFPAKKSPTSNERWYFCQRHAAEYNRNWNFFDGMSAEEAKRYAHEESRTAEGFARAATYDWGGAEDSDGFTKNERIAFEVLELEPGASQEEIKTSFRRLAKKWHPDRSGDDPTAIEKFQQIQAAYDLLREKTP